MGFSLKRSSFSHSQSFFLSYSHTLVVVRVGVSIGGGRIREVKNSLRYKVRGCINIPVVATVEESHRESLSGLDKDDDDDDGDADDDEKDDGDFVERGREREGK